MEITITIKCDADELKDLFGVTEHEETEDERIEKSGHSKYARIFDEGSQFYDKSSREYNLMFLRRQEAYFNDILRKRGNIFLNEVYDALGYPRTKEGCFAGWVFDEGKPFADSYVDFGLDHELNQGDGLTDNKIFLDFNVDGNILEDV